MSQWSPNERMARQHETKLSPDQVQSHEAVSAWTDFAGSAPRVVGIERLKEENKTRAYRLDLERWRTRTVIAKWRACPENLERLIFEEVLPSAGLPSLSIYGETTRGDDGASWMFIEDAGPDSFVVAHAADRVLAARWLATLHAWHGLGGVASRLPERSLRLYGVALRTSVDVIAQNLDRPWVTGSAREALARLIGLLERIDARWDRLQDLWANAPTVVVHGDFKAGNLRVRERAGTPELVVFDWEMAGTGAPCVDLAGIPDVESYAAGVRFSWPSFTPTNARTFARVGMVLRWLVTLKWVVSSLRQPWCHLPTFAAYEASLAEAVRESELLA